MRGRRASQGFTLMEILVAFVVLATAVAILYQTFSTGIRNVDAISGYSEAIAVAEAKLTAIGLEQALVEGEESGTTEDKRYKWTLVVKPYVPPDSTGPPPATTFNANQLLRATVTVNWDELRTQKRSVVLSTIRMQGRAQL